MTAGVATFYCGMQKAPAEPVCAHYDCLCLTEFYSMSLSGVLICATETANCIVAA